MLHSFTEQRDFITVPARHLRSGDVLSYSNSRWNTVIHEVEWTRDGQIKVSTGGCYGGVDFFEADELIQILPR